MELGAVGDVAALLESAAGSLRKRGDVAVCNTVQPLCDGWKSDLRQFPGSEQCR